MMKSLTISALLILGLGTLTNCSPYTQSDNSTLDSLGDLSCPSTSNKCVTPTPDNLNITVNLPNNAIQILLAAQTDFNVAGDCNEGGYASNTVRWELYEGATKRRESTSMGYSSSCVNGRFLLYVNLASTATDPVDRTTGRNAAGGKSMYQLRYSIWGIAPTGYVVGGNSSKSIYLQPMTN